MHPFAGHQTSNHVTFMKNVKGNQFSQLLIWQTNTICMLRQTVSTIKHLVVLELFTGNLNMTKAFKRD